MGKTHVLQVGGQDWSQENNLPEDLEWHFFTGTEITRFDKWTKEEKFEGIQVVLFFGEEALEFLMNCSFTFSPYSIFHDEKESIDFLHHEKYADFYKKNTIRPLDLSNPKKLMTQFVEFFFSGQYGEKIQPTNFLVSPSFSGSVEYNGHIGTILEGEFGKEYRSLGQWTLNIPFYRSLDLWFDFEKSTFCDIRLKVNIIPSGSIEVKESLVFELEQIEKGIFLEYLYEGYLSVNLEARGEGRLKIAPLHWRWSRGNFGKFLLGGEILKDEQRQEINYYFEPGDLKPPLMVYFSGFRAAEGFEGYYMMKSFGAPFLLFSDARLFGGAFYMGSSELESKVIQKIKDTLAYLGFSEKELIFSGLSMGSYGALYYATDFPPRYVVLGNPLANLGSIAIDSKLVSPGMLPPTYDILKYHTHETDKEAGLALNQHFWDKFNKGHFEKTVFALSYKTDEDLDRRVYDCLLENLYERSEKLISKSTEGRHIDGSEESVAWFVNQLKQFAVKEYGRIYK